MPRRAVLSVAALVVALLVLALGVAIRELVEAGVGALIAGKESAGTAGDAGAQEGLGAGVRTTEDGHIEPEGGTKDDAVGSPSGHGTWGLLGEASGSYEEEGEVEQVAIRLLSSYQARSDCVLASSGYLDLFGSVWSCVVQGDGWADVYLVTQMEAKELCRVDVIHLGSDEVSELLKESVDWGTVSFSTLQKRRYGRVPFSPQRGKGMVPQSMLERRGCDMGAMRLRKDKTRRTRGRSVRGQATVEYALVLLAFVSMLASLALLWHQGRDGALLRQATEASSHQLGGGNVRDSFRDLALF